MVQQAQTDYRTLELSPQDQAILAFAEKMTRESWTIQDTDVENLRSVGLSDREILDVVLIAAYYNFIDRVADALGVAVDEHLRS